MSVSPSLKGSFVGALNYLIHKDGDENPYNYMYQREDGGPQNHGVRKFIDCTVEDARPEQADMTLDRNGICVLQHSTALSKRDFYFDEAKIRQLYYQECEELVKRATGASRVIVFDHNVRHSDLKMNLNSPNRQRQMRQEVGGPPVTGPVVLCHNDYTVISAPQRIQDLAKPTGEGGSYTVTEKPLISEAEVPSLLENRYLFVNVWRNIGDVPIQRDPLAICDWTSIEEDDFIDSALVYKDRVGYTQAVRFDPKHRWVYFSELRRDEAMLLKCYDSKLGVAKWTAHSSVEDPRSPPATPPRESIEARCICFFAPGDKELTAERIAAPGGAWAKL